MIFVISIIFWLVVHIVASIIVRAQLRQIVFELKKLNSLVDPPKKLSGRERAIAIFNAKLKK